MPIVFQQTDTPMSCAQVQYCSPNGLNSDRKGFQAQVGGTPGGVSRTTPVDVGVANNAIWWELIVPSALWNAGAWTIRLRILAVTGAVTLTGVAVCRISQACAAVATIATGAPAIALFPGVVSVVVFGVSQTPDSGDKAVVVLGFSGVTSPSFTWVSDQSIDSPFAELHLVDATLSGEAIVIGAASEILSAAAVMSGEGTFFEDVRIGDQSVPHAMPSRGEAHLLTARGQA